MKTPQKYATNKLHIEYKLEFVYDDSAEASSVNEKHLISRILSVSINNNTELSFANTTA
jgi:hypothetical protein